jgi:ribose/xylose/arabinose/galactoside ABC-type transport system permease subunit
MDKLSKTSIPSDSRELKTSLGSKVLNTLGIYIGVIILALVGLVLDPLFLSPSHLLEIFAAEAQFLAIAIAGAYLITYGGKMADLSIPAIMTTAGFVTISCLEPFGFFPALLAGMLSGCFIGLINGLCIGFLKVNPIIWTLAMNFIVDGVLRWFFEGKQIYPQNDLFLAINQKNVPFYFLIFLITFFHLLTKSTKFGQSVLMVGASEKVSLATGVKNGKVITLMFVLSALCSAIAGICYCSSAKLATFNTGVGYDFKVVTAIVLGGVSLQGGKGYLSAAIGGLIFITFLETVMVLLGIQIYEQEIIKGVMFIAVVGFGVHLAKKAGRHV